MSSRLYALGLLAMRARVRVLLVWAAVLLLTLGGAFTLGTGTINTYSFPGTESQNALDALSRTFPQFSGTSAQVVAVAPSGSKVTDSAFRKAVDDAVSKLGAISQVEAVSSPYTGASTGNIAPDESAVIIPVQMSVQAAEVDASVSEDLQREGRTLQGALPKGSTVAVGGQLFSQPAASIGASEASGLVIAFAVLVLTFGALAAAGLPITTAVVGVGVSTGVVLTATRFVTITSTGPLLAIMLGLAVGVDYALFIVSRHQDQVRRGMTPEESIPRAVATAGSAVAFAATTVIIALTGLAVARIPFLTVTGVAAAVAVATAAVVALTLTPALLGFVGWRVVRRKHRPTPAHAAAPDEPRDDGATEDEEGEVSEGAATPADPPRRTSAEEPRGFFGRWVAVVTRWPPVTVVLVTAALAIVAAPATSLRLALPDAGSLAEGEPGRVAYDLVDEHFGPGYNGPLLLTGSVIRSTDPETLVDDIAADIAGVPGVVAVPLATPNPTGDTAVIQVVPSGAPDSVETEDVVKALRAKHDEYQADYGVDLSVTGATALGIDISTTLGSAVIPFGILVVGLSLVLLAMVFRSIVVPVTAALGYALSIAAAFGITSLVFMDGWLQGPLNVAHLGSVISFMPIILMGVLFGLAMDYEVFLVSRMREDYVHHADPHAAVHRGFAASARVVTAAAIIMGFVFAGFIPGGNSSIQPIAVGLTSGVLIDAFVVRMMLIPALLAWFGRAAWWFPEWLDRLLPHVDVEGEGLAEEDALADWPEPGDRYAIAADGVGPQGMPDGRSVLNAYVPVGEVLVVEGGRPRTRSALLLALTGRLALSGGRCKVAGLVLPARAASVRSRTAVVRLDRSTEPVPALLDALLAEPAVLVLDGTESVTDPAVRFELRAVLEEAGEGARARGEAGPTLVISGPRRDDVADLVPAGSAVHLASLDGPAALPARALRGEV